MASGISSGDGKETKYQKRRRKRGKNTSTEVIAMIGFACCLLLFGIYIWRSHSAHSEWRLKQMALRRAHSLMEQRVPGRGGKTKELNERLKKTEKELMNARMNYLPDEDQSNGAFVKRGRKRGLEKDSGVNLEELFAQIDVDVRQNRHGGIRWIPAKLLKELPGEKPNPLLGKFKSNNGLSKRAMMEKTHGKNYFKVSRKSEKPMDWEKEWNSFSEEQKLKGPKVDYLKHKYIYPAVEEYPPEDYPPLEKMGDMLKVWPQDAVDDPPETIVETLMHFNYSDKKERKMAQKYRDAKLPFKVYNVPELQEANLKWTDEYVSKNFDRSGGFRSPLGHPQSNGQCQESVNNFFAFFTPIGWSFDTMGPPPSRNSDWTYAKWAQHARYADAVSLSYDQPHFYFQSGVPREERLGPKEHWTFVSNDLPSFSSPTDTFFAFHVDSQKGIQCRFGERGVTAATHYDAGQNMVAMIKGAKRYILSPPRECSKLGIVTSRGNSIFRHSLLNFAHISHLGEDSAEGMSKEERAWLERAASAKAVDTVLKSGEVLFIPSHWFHYISSIQKSAQCNVRSGVDEDGTRKYGSAEDVYACEE